MFNVIAALVENTQSVLAALVLTQILMNKAVMPVQNVDALTNKISKLLLPLGPTSKISPLGITKTKIIVGMVAGDMKIMVKKLNSAKIKFVPPTVLLQQLMQ